MTFQSFPSPDLCPDDALPPVVDDGEASPRRCKRKRSMPQLPITPPASPDDPSSSRVLDRAVHVLATEAAALSATTRLYSTELAARSGLVRAVESVVKANEAGGKLIICGVGKSGYIGMKVVATMKSLGIASSFLHATEAVHGDLGDIRSVSVFESKWAIGLVADHCLQNDVILFVTYSGKTAELMNITPHLPLDMTIMALTAHTDASKCPLLANRPDVILLPATIPESEESTFGVSAPTTSTTVAMAIGDMLALTIADRLHQDNAGAVFKRNHPGGAIGARAKS
jgi:D-arabinose 5-phosphate isomerase GutQ